MKQAKQLFMGALVVLIICCIFFGCCRTSFFEGLENQPKDDATRNSTEVECREKNGMWSDETGCSFDSIDAEENVPTPEGFENY